MVLTIINFVQSLEAQGFVLLTNGQGQLGLKATKKTKALDEEERLRVRRLVRKNKEKLLLLLEGRPGVRRSTLLQLRKDGRCYCCGGNRFWLSEADNIICGDCHPPAFPEIVREWIKPENLLVID
jgi:hypothetical protein